jgi:glycosyltransferase 2 family protein
VKQRQAWIGIGISLVLVVFLFRQVEYRQLWDSLASADLSLLGLATALLSGTFAMRSWRWQYLLKPLKEVGFSSLMSATSIGLMANMLFPARLGEVVRAVVLGHREHIDKSASFATVIVERLLDGFTILSILAVLLLTASLPLQGGWAHIVHWGGLSTLVLYIGVLGALLYLHLSTARALRAVRRWGARLPARWVDSFARFLESFSAGLETLECKDHLGQIIVTSILLWGTFGVYNFLVVQAFHLHLPITVGFLLLVFQAFAVMLPASPGFVGTYHAASVACLSLWGVPSEVALGVALVMHAINFFLTIGFGGIYIWAVGMSWRDLTRPHPSAEMPPTLSS